MIKTDEQEIDALTNEITDDRIFVWRNMLNIREGVSKRDACRKIHHYCKVGCVDYSVWD